MGLLAAGDLVLAASDVDDSTIDFRNLRGPGRVLHLAHDFSLKTVLWTGQEGLVVGIAVHPVTRRIYTADPHTRQIITFDPDGRLEGAVAGLPARGFGTVQFIDENRALIGVHSARGPAPEDGFGEARLFEWHLESGEVIGHDVEIDGGRTGWHCVTNLTLDPVSETIWYVSEAGRRLCAYDLKNRRQLPDRLMFAEEDSARTYGLGHLADGRMLISTGNGARLIDAAGQTLQLYEVDRDKGWTRISLPPSQDGTFYLNNFLDGVLERREIEGGAVLSTYIHDRKCSMCGVAEVA